MLVITEDDGANRVLLEVEREPEAASGKLDHLAVLNVGKTVNPDDAVRQRDDRADVAGLSCGIEVLNPLPNQLADFGSFE